MPWSAALRDGGPIQCSKCPVCSGSDDTWRETKCVAAVWSTRKSFRRSAKSAGGILCTETGRGSQPGYEIDRRRVGTKTHSATGPQSKPRGIAPLYRTNDQIQPHLTLSEIELYSETSISPAIPHCSCFVPPRNRLIKMGKQESFCAAFFNKRLSY